MLFLDEIHRMARPAEEMLYLAMEDFRVDVIVGKGPGATAIPLELPPFTVVGATTRAGLLPGAAARPVRLHRRTSTSTPPTTSITILHRSAAAARRRRRRRTASRDRPAAPAAPRASPTGCCAGSATGPRCTATAWSTRTAAHAALALYDVDDASASTGSTGPCSTRCAAASAAARSGCRTLAVAVGEEPDTVETVAEPFLVREGFWSRTPRGRAADRRGLGAPRAPGAPGPALGHRRERRRPQWYTQPARRAAGGLSGR